MNRPSDTQLPGEALAEAEKFRREHDSAVLTVAFTDIAKSTELRDKLGEREYERLRVEHELELSGIVSDSSAGQVVKGLGDGALIVFEKPSVAVERLLDVQDAVSDHPHFRLRIGVDVGEVTRMGRGSIVSDVFGRHVNRASRIQSLAHPGHVLTSFPVYDMSYGWLVDRGIDWYGHGRCYLKGLGEHDIYEPYRGGSGVQVSIEHNKDREVELLQRSIAAYDRPVFSRSVPRRPEGESAGATAHESPRTRPRIRRTALPANAFSELGAIAYLGNRIRKSASTFYHRFSRRPAFLWVDDFPENNNFITKALRENACDVVAARSTDEGLARIAREKFAAVVTDMGRGSNPKAGLDILLAIGKNRRYTPALVFSSPTAVSRYGREAKKLGAAACTAGFITLLDALRQVIDWWISRPKSFED